MSNIAECKERFLELLRSTNREGIENLIGWLENETDFFSAPASKDGHGSYEGGLLKHSLNVHKLLSNFNKNIKNPNEDSLVIAGLLHDVCKTNFYYIGTKNVKENGRWQEKELYLIDDKLPIGHGEKSVYMLMKHICLSDEEAIAIRWHMGGFDDAARSFVSGKAMGEAYKRYPLAPALSIADMYATYFTD